MTTFACICFFYHAFFYVKTNNGWSPKVACNSCCVKGYSPCAFVISVKQI